MTLCFRLENMELQDYIDLDLASYVDSRRNTIGYVYTLGGTVVNYEKLLLLHNPNMLKLKITKANKEMICCNGSWKNQVRSRRIVSYIVIVIPGTKH